MLSSWQETLSTDTVKTFTTLEVYIIVKQICISYLCSVWDLKQKSHNATCKGQIVCLKFQH